MADETPARRILPPRERREAAANRYSPAPPSTLKRKAPASKVATPSKLATPASTSTTAERPKKRPTRRVERTPSPSIASTPPVEEILPTKLTSSKPLPVSRVKQAADLSSKEYQSIAESAIVAASLHRSRMQWLSDAIFKKYWVKPVKKKKVLEQPPDNPDIKSMVRLGTGTISVEPHKFDVVFYTVRETLPAWYKHPNQYTAKGSAPSTPMAAPYTPYKSPAPIQSATQPQAAQTAPSPASQPSAQAFKSATPSAGGISTQQPAPKQPAAPKLNSDPVIQMLAARAATDPQLKDLMKVVATSKANAEQLKEFQKHIDEFNGVVKRQEAERQERERAAAAQAAQSAQVGTAQPGTPQPAGSVNTPSQRPGSAITTPASAPGTTAPSTAAAQPAIYNTPRPPSQQMPNFNAAPPKVEPHIKHIVIEFTGEGASTDRFLFPAFAALDMTYGAFEMLASFFVERKGSDMIASLGETDPEELAAAQAKWKPDVEYYQPVTITVRATKHLTIETIARAAKTLPEVQEHMKKVLETKTRAPVEYLVHQLPREKPATDEPSADMVDSGVDMGSEDDDDELKGWYGNI